MLDTRSSNFSDRGFSRSRELLSGLGGEAFGKILQASAEILLIVDNADQIVDVSISNEEFSIARSWAGQSIFDTVSAESSGKIANMLQIIRAGEIVLGRHVNHALEAGEELPVEYQVAQLGDHVVFIGRSMEQAASLQRRLMSSQLSIERELSNLRTVEGRYRAAFHLSASPQMTADVAGLQIMDSNHAAAELLGHAPEAMVGKKFYSLLDEKGGEALEALLHPASIGGREGSVKVHLKSGDPVTIHVTPLSHNGDTQVLLSINPDEAGVSPTSMSLDHKILELAQNMPDSFVATTLDLKIVTANRAFYQLLGPSGLSEVYGLGFDQFFERAAVDTKVLIANVKENEVVNRFASTLKSKFGQTINVEIAACQLQMADDTVLGFWLRPFSVSADEAVAGNDRVGQSNSQIVSLVGHMPLKEIVRKTAAMIEALCIETALELTKNNRASAAQLLRVSRQSLYTKLDNTRKS